MTARRCRDDEGFSLIEMVIAMTLVATSFLALAHTTLGGMNAIQASRGRSVFNELANEEIESLRAVDFEAVGVSLTDPDYASAYPGGSYDGRPAVALDVAALQAADPAFPDPPAAVSTVTTSPVSGVLTPYTVRRWVTWSSAAGAAGATQIKRLDVRIEWSEGATARSVSLSSLLYPGNLGATSSNTAPTASFTASATTVPAGSAVSFDATGSSDAEGSIHGYAWQFGPAGATATGATPSYTYTTVGTYTVVLTVTDFGMLTHSTSRTITVNATPNLPPTAVLTATPTTGAAPLVVTVSGVGSSDPEGGPLTYAWSWGDATPGGGGVTSTHTYATSAAHTLRLTVTDNAGLTGSASTTVTTSGLVCSITAASFKNPGTNATSNDVRLKTNNKPNSPSFVFTATSNTACTSMSVSLPRSGGSWTNTLTYTDSGSVRTWSRSASFPSGTSFIRANNQTGTFTGSGGATRSISFNTHL